MELSPASREQSFSGSVAVRAVNRNLWLLVFGPWSLGDVSKRPFGMQGYLREIDTERFERMLRRVLGEDPVYHAHHHSVHDASWGADKDHDGKVDAHEKDAHGELTQRRVRALKDPHRYYDAVWSWLSSQYGEDMAVGWMPWESVDSIEYCGTDAGYEEAEEIVKWLEHFRESIPDVLVVHDKNVFDEMARSAYASLTSLGSLKTPFKDDLAEMMVAHPLFYLTKKPQ